MEIEELLLRGYGKFSNHRIALRPGINIIYGGNESGKSTIHSFIRAMFFGLSRGKGRAARKDEYLTRQPWDSPGIFMGSMRIREGGELYRIDRNFDRGRESLQLINETRAQESARPEQELIRLLGGVSETAFDHTVFIAQAPGGADGELPQELRKYMVNCVSSLDGDVDVVRSLQILRRKKKQLEQEQKKEDEYLETQIEECQSRADALRRDLELLRQQVGYRQREDQTEEEESASGSAAVSPILVSLVSGLLLIAAFLSVVSAFLMEMPAARLGFGGGAALLFGIWIALRRSFRGKAGRKSGTGTRGQGQSAPEEGPPELLDEIRARESAYRGLQDQLEELYQRHVRPEGVDLEIAAVTLAIDRICALSDRIFQTSGGSLGELASEILSQLTQGRYRRIVLDDAGEVRIHTSSQVLGLHQISMGTMQQIYFALRMAAGEVLAGETKLPLILDEPFALYDDKRLEAALRWLQGCGRQVILFTCQTREGKILKKLEAAL